jgi:hypothetical protein
MELGPGLYLPSEIVLNALMQLKGICIVQLFYVRRVSRQWHSLADIAIKKAGIVIRSEGETKPLTLRVYVPSQGVTSLDVWCDYEIKVSEIANFLSLMYGCLKIDETGTPKPNTTVFESHWSYHIVLSPTATRYVYEYETVGIIWAVATYNKILEIKHKVYYNQNDWKSLEHVPCGTYPPELIRPRNHLLRINKDFPVCMITHPTKNLHAFFRCFDVGVGEC